MFMQRLLISMFEYVFNVLSSDDIALASFTFCHLTSSLLNPQKNSTDCSISVLVANKFCICTWTLSRESGHGAKHHYDKSGSKIRLDSHLTLCDLIWAWIVYTITFHPQSTKSQSSHIMGHPNGNGGYVNGIGYLIRQNLAPSRFTSHLICYNSGRNNDSEAFHIVRLVFLSTWPPPSDTYLPIFRTCPPHG